MITFKNYLEEGESGLWDNIHAKQKRIKNGSGERMRKPGSKGAPTPEALKASQTNEAASMSPQQDMDFRKMMAGAMSRADYNAKHKKPLKPDNKVIYGKNVKEETKHIDEVKVWSSSHQKMMHHDEFPHTHTAKSDVHSSFSGSVIVKKGSRLSQLGNHNYLNIDTGQHPIKLEPHSGSKHEALVKEEVVAEGLPQTLRKVVPGYAKREIDKKMDDQKFGRTDVDKDANYYRYKKIQDKIKNKGVAEEVEEQFDLIEEVVEELAFINNVDSETLWEQLESLTDEELLEYAVDARGHKSSTGGLTQKGRDAYNAGGAHLKAPVTTPPSKLKAGSKAANRRKSFCARMGGMQGSMKKPNGEPSRKALALRKWNC